MVVNDSVVSIVVRLPEYQIRLLKCTVFGVKLGTQLVTHGLMKLN